MSFRLVPKSVTLNDLELVSFFFTEYGSFRAHCLNVVDRAIDQESPFDF